MCSGNVHSFSNCLMALRLSGHGLPGWAFGVGRIRREPPSGNVLGSGNKKTGQFPDPFFVSLKLTLNQLQRNPVQTAGEDNRRRQREDPGHQNVGHGFTLQTAAVDNHRTGYGRREHVGG